MQENSWLRQRLRLPSVSTALILVFVVVVLVGSFGVTVLLANDPNWARWHISYLGEGDSFSAHFFNVSMWIAGAMVVWLSLAFGRDLKALQASAPRYAAMHPMIVQAGIGLMGMCVYLIGLFPRSFGILPHDIFGHTIYLVFLLLCVGSPWILPGLPKWFYVMSYAFHASMIGLFVLYWTGVSESLYAAEVATFVFFLVWMVLLLQASRHTPLGNLRHE